MAHYAYLDEHNIVTQVIVGRDENDPLPDGVNSWEEYYGAKRCSYNTSGGEHLYGGTPFRKNFPGIGWVYSEELDGFYPPQPHPSWALNEDTCLWEAPIPYPGDENNFYNWDETTLSWVFMYTAGV